MSTIPPVTPPGSSTRFELNLGNMIQALILFALVWVGTSVNTLTAQMAVVQSQMADVPDIKRRLAQTELDLARMNAQISSNTARLGNLESQREDSR
jgi:hypothetical protein